MSKTAGRVVKIRQCCSEAHHKNQLLVISLVQPGNQASGKCDSVCAVNIIVLVIVCDDSFCIVCGKISRLKVI